MEFKPLNDEELDDITGGKKKHHGHTTKAGDYCPQCQIQGKGNNRLKKDGDELYCENGHRIKVGKKK